MCKQIRRKGWNRTQIPSTKTYPKSKWQSTLVDHPGQKVQIDIKYVPHQCILWNSYGKRYYQITSIDEYSRKRVCRIVDEKSVTHTAIFLLDLEERFGFKLRRFKQIMAQNLLTTDYQSINLVFLKKYLVRKELNINAHVHIHLGKMGLLSEVTEKTVNDSINEHFIRKRSSLLLINGM